ncbi:MAG TPA: MauE/DoxX family redox-associated membrane protein [Streptosporangiaceae bacterium]|jgi:hypothetical protein|nr:MauE/DoxX family redox-associated membrane protein [Streptosporangiaceae bacterium]
MLSAIREVQIPLLAAMLLGGSGAKTLRVLRARAVDVGLGPTALFPLRLRRPVAMFMCAAELGLGLGLILTMTRTGAGAPATAVRVGTAVLFLTAVGGLVELRERRPDMGCGCFGDLSATPVGLRTIARSALLALAALATVGQPAWQMPTSDSAAVLRIVILALEVILIAALSPEIGEALVRLGYSEPCEVRRVSVDRTLAALSGSAPWRRYARMVTTASPVDMWREGCWRYVVYPGKAGHRSIEIIFAVYLRSRRPQVRVALLDAITNEVLTWPHSHTPAAPAPGASTRLAGRRGFQPVFAAARPLAGPALRHGAQDALVADGATALRFAAPVHTPGTALPAMYGAPVPSDMPGRAGAYGPGGAPTAPGAPGLATATAATAAPTATAARLGGRGQHADYGHPGRKPASHTRSGSRQARHRSSAVL